jgi:hypothetical protein
VIRPAVLALILLLACVREGDAWSDLGHQAIAHAAYQMLDEPTKAAIARAAGLGRLRAEDLARMATWPDDIRRLERATGHGILEPQEIREAQTFMARFPDHPTWHYVNLPLGEPYPARANAYTRPNDVVGSLLRCVAVLEGRDSTPGLTKPIALRFLVHLAGDIHQPLHVGAGYFDVRQPMAPRLVRDPATARRSVSDLGGNRLAFGGTNLHATWDHGVVMSLGVADSRRLAAQLLAAMSTDPPPARSGSDHLGWPRDWATEASRIAANIAYPPLRFGPARGRSGAPARAEDVEQIDIAAPAHEEYVRDLGVRATARAQLARAAARLAALLYRIRW